MSGASSLRSISQYYAISYGALLRHKKGGHIPVSLIVERQDKESERGETLSEMARRILQTVIGIMDDSLKEGDRKVALLASKEVREYIRLLDSMVGDDESASVADDPGWQEIMRLIGEITDTDPASGVMIRERLAAATD
jgi:hypothetical protein